MQWGKGFQDKGTEKSLPIGIGRFINKKAFSRDFSFMPITTQPDLDALCARLADAPWICVDTEFMRERTYYPILCLVQVCGPDRQAGAIDPIAGKNLDWTPFYALLNDPGIVKVFHSGRQDLEIFFHLTGRVPAPVFDTQIAAMVCGHGESVGYESIVRAVTGEKVDKGSQFTDWARRPLTERQITYALGDVIHLAAVYEALSAEIDRRGRRGWIEEEDAVLQNPLTYRGDPAQLWRRIKIRSDKPAVLAVLRELAAWREEEAQRRDVPRGHVLKDEAMAEIALNTPQGPVELGRIRGLGEDRARGKVGAQILDCIARAKAMPAAEWPKAPRRSDFPAHLGPVVEMLKMLLRIRCAQADVVPRLVAGQEDLEAIAQERDCPALHGWRSEVFGADAQRLRRGEISFTLKGNSVALLESPVER